VGTVTRQRAGQPRNLGSIPCRVKRFVCSPKGFFHGVKRPVPEDEHTFI
jgi:hypothetical protein